MKLYKSLGSGDTMSEFDRQGLEFDELERKFRAIMLHGTTLEERARAFVYRELCKALSDFCYECTKVGDGQ